MLEATRKDLELKLAAFFGREQAPRCHPAPSLVARQSLEKIQHAKI
jgi:hypothetical protein